MVSSFLLCYLGTGVTVNAVHPGIVNTEISRYVSAEQNFFSKTIVKSLTWFFIKSPAKGSQTVIFAALDPSLSDVTGAYLRQVLIELIKNN